MEGGLACIRAMQQIKMERITIWNTVWNLKVTLKNKRKEQANTYVPSGTSV